jgi:hypothetical protein
VAEFTAIPPRLGRPWYRWGTDSISPYLPLYSGHVASACSACRFHSALPAYQGPLAADWRQLDSRDQARRLPGTDLRREPIEERKATLASILRKSRPGLRLNEHLEHPDGLTVFQHAYKMGLEGIVSKRLGSRYRSGRSPDWLKFKNPEAPAVKREAEEDWGAEDPVPSAAWTRRPKGRCRLKF